MRKLSVVLLLGMAVIGIVGFSYAEWAEHVVISEVQADSINGPGGTDDDWIELYNPTNEDIDLAADDYRIYKAATSTPSLVMRIGVSGVDGDGSYPGGTTIPAHGFYLIVRDDADATLKSKADAIGTKSSFTWTGTGCTLYLGTGAIGSDGDTDIVDKVGFGSATYSEGTDPAPEIPAGKSIERKGYGGSEPTTHPNSGNGWDANDNSTDFVIQSSANPQNSSDTLEPYVSVTVSETGVDYTFALGSEIIAVINFTNLTGSGSITVSPYPNFYPPNYPGGFPVKRYTSVTHSGTSNYTASLRLYYYPAEFAASDIAGNPTHLGRYTGAIWESHPASETGNNWVEADGITEFSIWGIGGEGASLLVDISSFVAFRTDSGVLVRWTTEAEVDHAGCDIYRGDKKYGKYVKINDELIRGGVNSGVTRYYQYIDKTAVEGQQYYYYLENIDIFGNRTKSDIIGISKDKIPPTKGMLSITWGAIKQKRRW